MIYRLKIAEFNSATAYTSTYINIPTGKWCGVQIVVGDQALNVLQQLIHVVVDDDFKVLQIDIFQRPGTTGFSTGAPGALGALLTTDRSIWFR